MTIEFTKRDQEIVAQTFASMTEDIDRAAAIFYKKFFASQPEAEALFAQADMHAQGRKLLKFFEAIVSSMPYIKQKQPDISELAHMHNRFGVKPEYLPEFGAALIETLREFMGRYEFTPEVEDTWMKVYAWVSEIMKDEMSGAE
ncbi:MAG: globin domain-containing protein [Chloroflexi bacterium]|nr:globin domain-containing protein [Chloroflexota bacterium]